jgi:ATP adenylyltransferase
MPEKKSVPQAICWLQPTALWERIVQRTGQALQSGALLSIPTEYEFVEQNGVRFLVRTLSNLVRKDEAKQQQEQQLAQSGKAFNPFLPYEEALFVADISETHVCILNKFNVVNHHLLVITREFKDQETLLTQPDFEALWACMGEFEGLAFYNAGKQAGASQQHKHLQLVPLPLTPEGVQIPIESLLADARLQGSVGTIPGLPFTHAFVRLDLGANLSRSEAAEISFKQYQFLLQSAGLQNNQSENGIQAGPYNLLVTRHWMLLVPRSRESFESIAVNSLGFAGTLLVRNEQQMQLLKAHGPMTVLSQVALPL